MSNQQKYSIEYSKNRTKGPLNELFLDIHAMTHGMSVIDDEN